MDPCVHIITLGVANLEQERRFYVDGLGWPTTLDLPGDVTFLQIGHGLLLGLMAVETLEADIGLPAPRTDAPAPVSLCQNVLTEDEVTATLDAAREAGGTILKPAQRADFGGFHGYFADPAGFRWEITTNPGWSVASDGTVVLVPIEG